jgi:hypothetical protein
MARIVRINPMVENNHLFTMRFLDEDVVRSFRHQPGQFVMMSVPGAGEMPISISSSPTRPGILEFCVRRVGRVTNALYRLRTNDVVGLRGPYGNGKYGMKCSACHQQENMPGPHMPPGAIIWRLPPPKMPMVFEGRSALELCEQLKDPARNGGKTLQEIVEHVTNDKLVGWGWNPGKGRTLPPLSREEFARDVKEWVEKGATCPK